MSDSRRNANRPDGETLRANLQYVDIRKHWRKIRPFADNSRDIWLPDMMEWLAWRALDNLATGGAIRWPDRTWRCPATFESCDWRLDHPGRRPRFWDYVCHSACHSLVNLNIHLAEQAFPDCEWRIVTAELHSTCWNGGNLIFDMNFLALGIPIDELIELTFGQPDTRTLPVGKRLSIPRWAGLVQDCVDGKLTEDELLAMWFGEKPKRRPSPSRRPRAAAA